eukprot:749499-Pyramimonas_sp.AAC.1
MHVSAAPLRGGRASRPVGPRLHQAVRGVRRQVRRPGLPLRPGRRLVRRRGEVHVVRAEVDQRVRAALVGGADPRQGEGGRRARGQCTSSATSDPAAQAQAEARRRRRGQGDQGGKGHGRRGEERPRERHQRARDDRRRLRVGRVGVGQDAAGARADEEGDRHPHQLVAAEHAGPPHHDWRQRGHEGAMG